MGTTVTDRVIHAPMTIENHGAPGTFGLVSRDPTQTIYVDMYGPRGGETIEVVNPGDSCSFDLKDVDQVVIRAAAYPTRALIDFTNLAIVLAAAPFLLPSSIVSTHKDATVAGAATTTLWTPATGKRFVITEFMLSTDTSNRVALVDGSDVAGKRIAAPYLAADGGMVGGPYASQAVDTALILVTAAGGNVFASVDGYESD